MQEQANARVLHLAGASNIHTTACGDSMDDRTSTSASSSAGISPAIQSENIHPTLFEYLQVIQKGDANFKESSDSHTTESISSEKLNRLASSGHQTEGTTTSALTSLEVSSNANTGPSASSAQPPAFQTQAGSLSWPRFETAQSSFAQGNVVPFVDPPLDSFNSIFRFQSPSISTQYPQLFDETLGPQLTSAVGPSSTPDDTSGSFGIGAVQMGDPNAGDGMDFAQFIAENVPSLVYDGGGIGWDTFLTDGRLSFDFYTSS